ncbi:hypothetical protein ACHAXN_012636 [Cyclotella atomus]
MSCGAAAARLSNRHLQNATQRPTSLQPTTSPPPTDSLPPTVTNTSVPSSMPSYSVTLSYFSEADFQHTLKVSEQRVMEEAEEYLYDFIMENLTLSIGEMVGEPLINSNCTVTDTQNAIGRRLEDLFLLTEGNETNVEDYLLVVTFTCAYSSRYGYDISYYPEELQDYINSNQAEVTDYLTSVINLSSEYILESGMVIIEVKPLPTASPTKSPSILPSSIPSGVPSFEPSVAPSSFVPLEPTDVAVGAAVGIAIGSLLGAALIFMGLRMCLKKKQDLMKDNLHENGNEHATSDRYDVNESLGHAFMTVPVNESSRDKGDPAIDPEQAIQNNDASPEKAPSPEQDSHNRAPSMASNLSSHSEGGDSFTMQPNGIESRDQTSIISPTSPNSTDCSLATSTRSKQASDVETFIGANLLMRDDSFSSDSNDDALIRDTDFDEFDQYKNEALEQLRKEVERSIYDVDSMMSLAMTRIFMEVDTLLDLSWVGAEDPASIEASCYFETFDWMKQNTASASSETFFQDMLNRVVQIVHRGLIRPSDGARLLHGCASILEMQLLRELPRTTVVVRGLRKTNDLAQGHHSLVKSFGCYGDIVDASISPKNKGFGFVRFVQPQSVVALMHRYENSEIEIQDVSVSIIPIGLNAK